MGERWKAEGGTGGQRRTGGGGGAQGRRGDGSRRGGLGFGLTIVGVNAQLDFPLDGSLNLLLPHTLDAQVVEAAWGEGKLSEEAGVALTPRRDPKIAPCLGARSLSG